MPYRRAERRAQPNEKREGSVGRGILIGIVAGMVCFLAGGLIVHNFDIFAPRSGAITTTRRYLFTADAAEPADAITQAPFPATKMKADCWVHAISTTRPDAYRCSIGNYIYDPCFSSFFLPSGIVVCPQAPWSGTSLVAKSTRPLSKVFMGYTPDQIKAAKSLLKPTPDDVTSIPSYMWAAQLTNGADCWAFTGTGMGEDGLILRYLCTNGGQIDGLARPSGPLWYVTYFAPYSHDGQQVAVAEAWF